MTDEIIKKFDEIDKLYAESKNRLRGAKDTYEFVKAKERVKIRTRFTVEGKKFTIQEIEDALTIEQADLKSELGKAFLDYTIALAQKEVLFTERKAWERRYWDSKGLLT